MNFKQNQVCLPTEAMLDGKAYYRAVRGYQLTYEALWQIKFVFLLYHKPLAPVGFYGGTDELASACYLA